MFNLKPGTKHENWFVFDIESNGLYDEVTEIFCIVIYDFNRKQTFSYGPDCITDALDHLATADCLIGHNILFYDIPVLKKLWPGFELFNSSALQIIDTLICTRLIWPKEKLEELDSEIYYRLPSKLRGSASLKAWGYRLSDKKIDFQDFSEFSEEMLAYCIQDVNVTTKLLQLIQQQSIHSESLALEHEFATCIERQIRSGFPFDTDAALSLVDKLSVRSKQIEDKLKEIFPPIVEERWSERTGKRLKDSVTVFNPNSRAHIIQRFKDKYNWTPEKLTEKGNPILNDDVLEKLPYPEAQPLAEYMLIKKRLGQIQSGTNAWLKLVSPDGYIHGDVITNGCITGRCSHRNPNTAQTPAAYSPYGKECRSLFHAPDDWFLIGSDAKALELRCLAGYLAYWDEGEYSKLVIDDDTDIHIYNQEKFGVKTRDISKRLLYAVLYGCGSAKAGTIVDPNEKDINKLKQLGKNAIDSFMTGIPAIKALKDTLAKTLEARGFLIGLDKRPLFCRSDFKALNVLLQAAGAVLMKQVVINTHNNLIEAGLVYGIDYHQHAMIHDEIELSCPKQNIEIVKENILKSFIQSGEHFNFLCPIEGDAKVGKTWFDVH
ncbi:MAG: putative DNA polymerase [Prokaryotic dsDNA virus sp.]|nr:MAG: putative DNA polymerase [Prokaryotic dsDNA virus sp.]|tara:strand:+ start:15050 stop:16858 length:1809 start_codon:yes stop_codon:yes gene_type:complete